MAFLRTAVFAASATLLCLSWSPSTARGEQWLNQDWPRRLELTADPQQISGDTPLSNVTLLVHLDGETAASVFAEAKADGSDLLFTAGDGTTLLSHEMVRFDAVAEEAELWFRPQELSSTENVFYLYFGNADTTVTPSNADAWSEDHLAVYHFDEDPGVASEIPDSGPGDGQNPAMVGAGSTWSNSDLVAGQAGRAWRFDGIDDWLYAASIQSPDSSFTVSAWLAKDTFVKSMHALQVTSDFWDLSFARAANDPNGSVRTSQGEMAWRPDILDGDFHHYVWVLDAVADTARFFLDGIERTKRFYYKPMGSPGIYTAEPLQGRAGIAGPAFGSTSDRTQGVVDEYHIVEGARSDEQVVTQYRNQVAPQEFFSLKQELYDPVTSTPPIGDGRLAGRISVWPNPFQYSAQIEVESRDPSYYVGVYDVAGRLVRRLQRSSTTASLSKLFWDGRDGQGEPVSSGIYYIRAAGPQVSLGKKVLVIR